MTQPNFKSLHDLNTADPTSLARFLAHMSARLTERRVLEKAFGDKPQAMSLQRIEYIDGKARVTALTADELHIVKPDVGGLRLACVDYVEALIEGAVKGGATLGELGGIVKTQRHLARNIPPTKAAVSESPHPLAQTIDHETLINWLRLFGQRYACSMMPNPHRPNEQISVVVYLADAMIMAGRALNIDARLLDVSIAKIPGTNGHPTVRNNSGERKRDALDRALNELFENVYS